jgi:hypothetical protein
LLTVWSNFAEAGIGAVSGETHDSTFQTSRLFTTTFEK